MVRERLKRQLLERLISIHSKPRVAGFLRALSVVGIFAGFSGFMIGFNPLVAFFVIDFYDPGGDALIRIGIVGLLVHVASVWYYHATEPALIDDDGLIRY